MQRSHNMQLRLIEQACRVSTLRGGGGHKMRACLCHQNQPSGPGTFCDRSGLEVCACLCRRYADWAPAGSLPSQQSRREAPTDRASLRRVLHGAGRRRPEGGVSVLASGTFVAGYLPRVGFESAHPRGLSVIESPSMEFEANDHGTTNERPSTEKLRRSACNLRRH